MTGQVMLCERCGALASLRAAPYLCSRCAAMLPEMRATPLPPPGPAAARPREDRSRSGERGNSLGVRRPGLVGGVLGCVVSALFLLGAFNSLGSLRHGAPLAARVAPVVLLVVALVGLGFAIGAIHGSRAGVLGNAVAQIVQGLISVLGVLAFLRDDVTESSITSALVGVGFVVASGLAVSFSRQELARRRAG